MKVSRNRPERATTGSTRKPSRVQIAATHVYLMENGFVTGTVITVDGGALPAVG